MHTSNVTKPIEDGKPYVLVKVDDDESGTPESAGSETAETKSENGTPAQCPEIVYKVQYKDFSGDIKGTKLLDAPYKFKKAS